MAVGVFSAEEQPKQPGTASASLATTEQPADAAEQREEAIEAELRQAEAAKKRAAARARAERRRVIRKAKRQRARNARLRKQRARARAIRAERRRERELARQLQAEEEQASECHPSYEGACLDPNASDYDCSGGSGDGPEYTGTVQVVGPDDYDLDRDGDGVGCDS